jgi:hypothetical protein
VKHRVASAGMALFALASFGMIASAIHDGYIQIGRRNLAFVATWGGEPVLFVACIAAVLLVGGLFAVGAWLLWKMGARKA